VPMSDRPVSQGCRERHNLSGGVQCGFRVHCVQCARPLDRPCSRFEPDWARVVSGVDEGVFGWIALNYATGHLAVNPALAAEAQPSAPGKSQASGVVHSRES
jgi:GDA1/CD39 (nucleoside phosphatase) family